MSKINVVVIIPFYKEGCNKGIRDIYTLARKVIFDNFQNINPSVVSIPLPKIKGSLPKHTKNNTVYLVLEDDILIPAEKRKTYRMSFFASISRIFGIRKRMVKSVRTNSNTLDLDIQNAVRELIGTNNEKLYQTQKQSIFNQPMSNENSKLVDVINKFIVLSKGDKEGLLRSLKKQYLDTLDGFIRKAIYEKSLAGDPNELKGLVDLLFDLRG